MQIFQLLTSQNSTLFILTYRFTIHSTSIFYFFSTSFKYSLFNIYLSLPTCISLSSLKQEQRSHQTSNGPNPAPSSQPNNPTQPPPPRHHHRNIKKKNQPPHPKTQTTISRHTQNTKRAYLTQQTHTSTTEILKNKSATPPRNLNYHQPPHPKTQNPHNHHRKI